MTSDIPKIILLFSGKRKSGKDYITEKLYSRLCQYGCVIIRLSGPIKSQYAANHNLDQEKLLTSCSYKEQYRKDMITWSERIRASDYGVFITEALKAYKADDFPIWVVSDMRRRSDLKWFTDHHLHKFYTVRIKASDNTRQTRGYIFTQGIDDAESECDLDTVDKWDFIFQNDLDSPMELDSFLKDLEKLCQDRIS